MNSVDLVEEYAEMLAQDLGTTVDKESFARARKALNEETTMTREEEEILELVAQFYHANRQPRIRPSEFPTRHFLTALKPLLEPEGSAEDMVAVWRYFAERNQRRLAHLTQREGIAMFVERDVPMTKQFKDLTPAQRVHVRRLIAEGF